MTSRETAVGKNQSLGARIARAEVPAQTALEAEAATLSQATDAETPQRPGMGLSITRYRASVIGGSRLFRNAAGEGTAVVRSLHFSVRSNLNQGRLINGT